MLDMSAHLREKMDKTVETPSKIFIKFICILLLHTKQIICPAHNLIVRVLYGLLFIISSKVLEINALY